MLHCLICNHRCGTAKALRVHLGTINKTRTDHRICSTDVTHTAFASFGGLRQEAEMIYSMFIVNKSGGLIFNKDFADVARLDLNDVLRLASIWHSLHAIAIQLSPVPDCTGIELLEADTFNLHCFQTLTGTKFLMVVEPNAPYIPGLLQRVYELYTDFVLKNPFYEVEQVIKCELFDEALEALMRSYPPTTLGAGGPAGQPGPAGALRY